MTTLTLCWLAALIVAFFLTVGWIRGGNRQEQTLMVPIKLDEDADPRRRRKH